MAGSSSVSESASPVLVSQAVKDIPPPVKKSPTPAASSPTQQTLIPRPKLNSTTIPQMKIISTAALQPKTISNTAPKAPLIMPVLSSVPSIPVKPVVLDPVGMNPAFQPPLPYRTRSGFTAPALVQPRAKRNVEESGDLDGFDPFEDLENSKQNLKNYIIDENKNDMKLLHDLEEKLKREEDFQTDGDYLLSPDPVKESYLSESFNDTIKESLEGDQLGKVLQLLILEAEKVKIQDAKKIALRAVTELANAADQKRRKRSIPEKLNLHKVESDTLSHILKEVNELQELIRTKNVNSPEDKSGSKYRIETKKKGRDPEEASIESSLLDHVTTLLSRSAVEHMLGGTAARSSSLNEVLEENMKKTLLDEIVSRIAESVVHCFMKSRSEKDEGAEPQERRRRKPISIEVLDDYQLDGQAVHQQPSSFGESDPLGEFSMFRVFRSDPGSDHTLRSSSEESGEDLSPLLSKVSRKDLKPERVLEEKGEGIQSFRVEGDNQSTDNLESYENTVHDAARRTETENGQISGTFDTFNV